MSRELYTEKILEQLRLGGVVMAGRQTGKTTALLRLAHEFEDVVVVARDGPHAEWLKMLYGREFPGDRPLKVVHSSDQLRGMSLGTKILVDELRGCRYTGLFFAATDSVPTFNRIALIGDDGAVARVGQVVGMADFQSGVGRG